MDRDNGKGVIAAVRRSTRTLELDKSEISTSLNRPDKNSGLSNHSNNAISKQGANSNHLSVTNLDPSLPLAGNEGQRDQGCGDESKETASRTHNTRSKNGMPKQKKSMFPVEPDRKKSSSDPLEECAAVLATMDLRAYQRCLIRDSDAVLHGLLLPMSFPWSSQRQPIHRAFPRDLDEMQEIMSVGVEGLDYKQNGMVSKAGGAEVQYAVRRSSDPGILELTSYVAPSLSQLLLFRASKGVDDNKKDPTILGELTSRMYNDALARKNELAKLLSRRQKKRLISFRLGNSSSRATIFENASGRYLPMLLPAVLPKDAVEGVRMSGSQARRIIEGLGTYNCRHESESPGRKNQSRVMVGRNRLMWSEREPKTSSANQRSHYRSILTGERMDNLGYKRPRCVRVGIRANGRVLSVDGSIVRNKESALAAALAITGSSPSFDYSTSVINEALDLAFTPSASDANHAQCRLGCDSYVSKLLNLSGQPKHRLVSPKSGVSFTVKSRSGPEIDVKLPTLDCIPTEDGLISVVCTSSGTMNRQGGASVDNVFEDIAIDEGLCKVCMSPMNGLNACEGCRQVHVSCLSSERSRVYCPCYNRQSHVHVLDSSKPFDNAGEERRPICYLCQKSYGVLRSHGEPGDALVDEGQQVHDVCDIWLNRGIALSFEPSSSRPWTMSCSVCSETNGMLVPCHADNCQVAFHPICALFLSCLSKHYYRNEAKQGANKWNPDEFLTTQYTLCFANTTLGVSPIGAMPALTLPVAFCGYHNPQRTHDLYGLPPEGSPYLEDVLRVPPQRWDRSI